jgi:hypothetical protein
MQNHGSLVYVGILVAHINKCITKINKYREATPGLWTSWVARRSKHRHESETINSGAIPLNPHAILLPFYLKPKGTKTILGPDYVKLHEPSDLPWGVCPCHLHRHRPPHPHAASRYLSPNWWFVHLSARLGVCPLPPWRCRCNQMFLVTRCKELELPRMAETMWTEEVKSSVILWR